MKAWHKKGAARKLVKATEHWPEGLPVVAYDGAPTPLRQGHGIARGRGSWA